MSFLSLNPFCNLVEAAEMKEILKQHIAKRLDGTWQCVDCGFVKNKRAHVEDHVESNHVSFSYSCPFSDCEKALEGYRSKKSLNQHLRIKHSQLDLSSKTSFDNPQYYLT